MPASAGRTRMPHNNRMSIDASLRTSSIWSKTIGHDPHAGREDATSDQTQEQHEESNKTRDAVLAVARQQNLTDGASRDDFALKMYQGLKQGKKKRADEEAMADGAKPKEGLHDDPLSSSEDEFVAVAKDKERKKRNTTRHKKRKHKRKRSSHTHGSSDDSQSESESDSSEDDRRRSKKRKHGKRSRKYSDDDDDGSNDSSHDRRKRRKSKHSHKHKSKHRRRSSSGDASSDFKDNRHKEKDSRQNDESSLSTRLYIPSEAFAGSRRGYVFKRGESGVGYYLDKPPKVSR